MSYNMHLDQGCQSRGLGPHVAHLTSLCAIFIIVKLIPYSRALEVSGALYLLFIEASLYETSGIVPGIFNSW